MCASLRKCLGARMYVASTLPAAAEHCSNHLNSSSAFILIHCFLEWTWQTNLLNFDQHYTLSTLWTTTEKVTSIAANYGVLIRAFNIPRCRLLSCYSSLDFEQLGDGILCNNLAFLCCSACKHDSYYNKLFSR